MRGWSLPRISSRIRSCSARNSAARGTSRSPSAVSATRRVDRTKSGTPSSRSSRAISRLSACWATYKRAAARPKCSSWATATKFRNSRGSMLRTSHFSGSGGRIHVRQRRPRRLGGLTQSVCQSEANRCWTLVARWLIVVSGNRNTTKSPRVAGGTNGPADVRIDLDPRSATPAARPIRLRRAPAARFAPRAAKGLRDASQGSSTPGSAGRVGTFRYQFAGRSVQTHEVGRIEHRAELPELVRRRKSSCPETSYLGKVSSVAFPRGRGAGGAGLRSPMQRR
jgi:hypothetical protein